MLSIKTVNILEEDPLKWTTMAYTMYKVPYRDMPKLLNCTVGTKSSPLAIIATWRLELNR